MQLRFMFRGAARSAAAAALLVAATATQATVITVTFPTPLVIPDTIDGVYLNLLTGMTGTSGSATPGWDINPYARSGELAFFAPTTGGIAAGPGGIATATPSLPISGSTKFKSGVVLGNAFHDTATGYLGFKFLNESTGATNYGYAVIRTSAATGFPASIVSYSFENTGGAFGVPIPEPATGLMLAAGLLTLLALKRR